MLLEETTVPFTRSTRLRLHGPADPPQPVPLLVALHGQGMSAAGFDRLLGLTPLLDRFVLIPEGPLPFEKRRAGTIEIGHGWYVYRGDQDEFRDQLVELERWLLALIDGLARRHAIATDGAAILGYSQGGYLAGWMAARNRQRWSDLVLMSTRFKHEFVDDALASGSPPRTLVIHSENDPAIRWQHARMSIAELERAGAELTIHLHDEGHRIPAGIGERIAAWLKH